MLSLLLLAALCHAALGAREADRVTYVPGLDPQPTFRNYAGYLSASPTRRFFYWFVESERDPANDPVVLWLNGGPGCSSMTGFLVELGPWRVKKDGSGLDWFEQRWNKIANIIFMESPQCVGYSYDNATTCASGDDEVAYDNHMALKDFFVGFPEYRTNVFYVTGESYAGFYVPTLSVRLADDPDFNFQGFAVGNAVTDYRLMDNALVYFTWARGLFATDSWNILVSECCPGNNATDCDFQAGQSVACQSQLAKVSYICWYSGLNPYQLYDDCYGGVPGPNGVYEETSDYARMVLPDALPLLGQGAREQYLDHFRKMYASKPEVYSSIPCTDTSDREIYLNNPEVRQAIHVPDFVQRWEACSSDVGALYDRQYDNVFNEYNYIHSKGHRILVFNGDLDMACNHLGDLWFVEQLNKPLVEPYRNWFWEKPSDNTTQIAGYVVQYENLVFLTVKGAGHFVPTDKPIPAYTMWEHFIYNTPYP